MIFDKNILGKIEKFITASDLYAYFKGNIFKNLDKEDFKLLLLITHDWYFRNVDISKKMIASAEFKKLNSKLMVGLTLPNYIYRGLSFKSPKDLNDFLSQNKKGILGSKKSSITSWSIDRRTAMSFIKKYTIGEYGALLKLKTSSDLNILFSLNALLKSDKDRLKFLELVMTTETDTNISRLRKSEKITKSISQFTLFGSQWGSYYAATEEEYLLQDIKINNNITVELFHKRGEKLPGYKPAPLEQQSKYIIKSK